MVEDVADDPAGRLRRDARLRNLSVVLQQGEGAVPSQRGQGREGFQLLHEGDVAAAQDEGVAVVRGGLRQVPQPGLPHQMQDTVGTRHPQDPDG